MEFTWNFSFIILSMLLPSEAVLAKKLVVLKLVNDTAQEIAACANISKPSIDKAGQCHTIALTSDRGEFGTWLQADLSCQKVKQVVECILCKLLA